MTKKDFELIAQIIHDMPKGAPSLRAQRASCASSFADKFSELFPRFDATKFFKASIGYNPHIEFDPFYDLSGFNPLDKSS